MSSDTDNLWEISYTPPRKCIGQVTYELLINNHQQQAQISMNPFYLKSRPQGFDLNLVTVCTAVIGPHTIVKKSDKSETLYIGTTTVDANSSPKDKDKDKDKDKNEGKEATTTYTMAVRNAHVAESVKRRCLLQMSASATYEEFTRTLNKEVQFHASKSEEIGVIGYITQPNGMSQKFAINDNESLLQFSQHAMKMAERKCQIECVAGIVQHSTAQYSNSVKVHDDACALVSSVAQECCVYTYI